MHLITGFILAALAGRGQKDDNTLPGMTRGPLRVSHSLPGRMRLRAEVLRNNVSAKDLVETKLQALEAVDAVSVNTITGSVLVSYKEKELEPGLLFAVLVRVLGLEKEFEKPPKPIIANELKEMADSLNRFVYDKTNGIVDLWTVLFLLIAGQGIRELYAGGKRAIPPGFTLLWWASHGLLREKRPS